MREKQHPTGRNSGEPGTTSEQEVKGRKRIYGQSIVTGFLGNQSSLLLKKTYWGFSSGPVAKNLPSNAGDVGPILGLGRSHTPLGINNN